jgi:hypothetical protein
VNVLGAEDVSAKSCGNFFAGCEIRMMKYPRCGTRVEENPKVKSMAHLGVDWGDNIKIDNFMFYVPCIVIQLCNVNQKCTI